MRIQISLSAPGLFLNKENFRQARGNKHAGMIVMNPEDFLRLCVPNQRSYDSIMDEAKTLAEYNSYTKAGKSIHAPWLYVTLDGQKYSDSSESLKIGQVVGHEGRHRAAALIKAGVKKMPVSLRLYMRGIERAYQYTPENPWGKDPWTKDDLPKTFYGEFNPHYSCQINTATFKSY